MEQYLKACNDVLETGHIKSNRNGNTIALHDMMMKFNLADGFPAVTTKKLQFKSVTAELLGFVRGADNAKTFNELGTKIWDANAEADYWTSNPSCKGDGDLGRIYSRQWRDWRSPLYDNAGDLIGYSSTDQLAEMVQKLIKGVDDRRNIVQAFNPGELDQMALPACHATYQCHLREGTLDMLMYQRSCDLPLGVPFNIASYALLMHIFCRIAGLKLGVFTWVGGDCHIYEDQVATMYQQTEREPFPLPTLRIDPKLKTLKDFEEATADQFSLENYEHWPDIKHEFSV